MKKKLILGICLVTILSVFTIYISKNMDKSENNISVINEDINSTYTLDRSNNYLSLVTIEGVDFKFDKNTTDYKLYVDDTQEDLVINYDVEDKRATVKLIAGDKLEMGDNSIVLSVTAVNGEVRNYNFTIMKEGEKKIVSNDKGSIIEGLNGNKAEVYIKLNEGDLPVAIDSDIIKVLKDTNKKLIFEWYDIIGLYSSLKIINTNLRDDVMIKPSISDKLENEVLLDYIGKNEAIKLNFNNTNIPLGSIYKVRVDDGSNYNLIYSLDGKILTKKLSNNSGFVEFTLENSYEYMIISDKTLEEVNKGSRYDFIVMILLSIIIGLIFAILIVIFYRKRQNKLSNC